jgi:hypothetical protein
MENELTRIGKEQFDLIWIEDSDMAQYLAVLPKNVQAPRFSQCLQPDRATYVCTVGSFDFTAGSARYYFATAALAGPKPGIANK